MIRLPNEPMKRNAWTAQSPRDLRVWTKLIGWWLVMCPLLMALGFSAVLSGCQADKPKVLVIPADRLIRWASAGSTNSIDGYLVPPARMQEILHALESKTNGLNY